MNQSDVSRIESSLGVGLPESYRDLLLDFPANLAAVFPSDCSPDERRLFNTPDPSISTNSLVRCPDHLIDSGDPDSRWPDRYLIVGMDIGCNFYCINRNAKHSAVFFWFHEDGDFEKHTANLSKFASELTAYYGCR
tara:strand:- start:27 stop:434 length:408 start_codon:yes stop_codon:yes gene_type:complete